MNFPKFFSAPIPQNTYENTKHVRFTIVGLSKKNLELEHKYFSE